MNKILTIAILLAISFASHAQITKIPDPNFEQALIDLGYDSTLDGEVNTASISSLYSLDIRNKNISDLTGIEGFTNLVNLTCFQNQLTKLNLSQNEKLAYINCSENNIDSLNLSNNQNLTTLNAYNNKLTYIEFGETSNIDYLAIGHNQLNELNLNNLTKLKSLQCQNNTLSQLDLSNQTSLQNLYCINNDIISIQVPNQTIAYSANTNRSVNGGNDWVEDKGVYYTTTPFDQLEMTAIIDEKFEQALIDNGYDSKIDGSIINEAVQNISSLLVKNKQISDITGIEAFVNLQSLDISNNAIQTINISKNIKLNSLVCFNNQLTDIDLSLLENLSYINCANNNIDSLDLTHNTYLRIFYASQNNISSLNFENNLELEVIGINNNKLTQLNLVNQSLLKNLNCSMNSLYCVQVVDQHTADYANDNYKINGGEPWIEDGGVYYSTTPCDALETIEIPDENFEQALIDAGHDPIKDGYIVNEAAKKIQNLDIKNKGISSLAGIESFINLSSLDCSHNDIKSLDLSENKKLNYLSCQNNQLANLNLEQNIALTTLKCENNSITSLDIENNIELDYLDATGNQITSLDLTGNSKISILYISENQLKDINLENLSELKHFRCGNNQLDSLNVNNNLKLYTIDCRSNNLSSLDFTNNKELEYIYCHKNSLVELDVSKNDKLINLICGENNLTKLDISKNLNLSGLSCTNNLLYCIKVASAYIASLANNNRSINNGNPWSEDNGVIYTIESCENLEQTIIPDPNFERALIELGHDAIVDGKVLTQNISNETYLSISSRHGIEDATGIEDFKSLRNLYFSQNILKGLDLSKNTNLTHVRCDNNNLDSLKLPETSTLLELLCNKNNLSKLDISKNPNLNSFNCSNNDLNCVLVATQEIADEENTSIDVSPDNWNEDLSVVYSATPCEEQAYTEIPDTNFETKLISLGYDNIKDGQVITQRISSLTSLNLFNSRIVSLQGIEDFTSLESLNCSHNYIRNIDLRFNTNLKSLRVYYNELDSIDLSHNTELEYVNLYGNNLNYLDLSQLDKLQSLDTRFNSLNCITVANEEIARLANNNEIINEGANAWVENEGTIYSAIPCNQLPMTLIPDSNFEQALIDLGYDNFIDGAVLTAKIDTLTELNVNGKNIADLSGIEYFTALEVLFCNNNQLTLIHIDSLEELRSLDCSNNELTQLNISNNTSLETIWCNDNQISTLDLSTANQLEGINCNNNLLTNIELTNNTDLEWLYCSENNLSSINISQNLYLVNFTCERNNLNCIQVGKQEVADLANNDQPINGADDPWLEDLGVLYSIIPCDDLPITQIPDNNFENELINLGYDNVLDGEVLSSSISGISSINLSNKGIKDLTGIEDFESLNVLYCKNNELTSLNLSNNTNLTDLYCSNNQLTSLNLSNNDKLKVLQSDSNQLACIYVANNTIAQLANNDEAVIEGGSDWIEDEDTFYSAVSCDEIAYISIPDPNFEQALIDLGYDDVIDQQVVSNRVLSIENIDLSYKGISDLTGIEGFLSLETLNVRNNQIQELNLENNIALANLNCQDNNIIRLDISQNANLEILHCQNNVLDSLNLMHNSLLEEVFCHSNQLKDLNLGNNLSLTRLVCSDNLLSELNISQAIFLQELYCHSNFLTMLDISNQDFIYGLSCYENLLQCIQVSSKTIAEDANNNQTINGGWESWREDSEVLYSNTPCPEQEYTLIPDVNFETALIDLGYDYKVDGKVLTQSISDITSLDVSNREISDLTGLEDFAALKVLKANNNSISTLDVTQNQMLNRLKIWDNQLTSLTLDNPELIEINCKNNKLENIVVTRNPKLVTLNCINNALTSLNLNENTELKNFYCKNNKLDSLDLSNNTALRNFNGAQNNFACIQVNDQNTADLANQNLPINGGNKAWIEDADVIYSISSCNPIESISSNKLKSEQFISGVESDEQTVNIYPNPAEDFLKFEGVEIREIIISELTGIIVLRQSIEENTVNISHIPSGLYLIHITDKKGISRSQKIIIQ
ncbi:T9SS type A sorting domain-containing protein [Aureibacter tunicatorum]|uniref:Leucine-rich repeat (LRR) protein n=1 Tax=Aureibacter tunicatorum TaxID=866807 RepID=A0AAE3XQ52_9BACT|nr:T9SS type A sorting domain-containing protein [Aureibacter tunicatorum]MDR6240575.1 Leucine-rich repeat (LRR) protein [Aureibacter tunicatorum]BDD06564.1 hypothetical protein AUTU_40470 [Aureibacter tunicatorum]